MYKNALYLLFTTGEFFFDPSRPMLRRTEVNQSDKLKVINQENP